MEKITFSKLSQIMSEFNERFPEKADTTMLVGVIVYKQDKTWNREYSELERSYEVSNANRQFQPGKISNSLRGYCLDGKDLGVRLDLYDWEVDYCYME